MLTIAFSFSHNFQQKYFPNQFQQWRSYTTLTRKKVPDKQKLKISKYLNLLQVYLPSFQSDDHPQDIQTMNVAQPNQVQEFIPGVVVAHPLIKSLLIQSRTFPSIFRHCFHMAVQSVCASKGEQRNTTSYLNAKHSPLTGRPSLYLAVCAVSP